MAQKGLSLHCLPCILPQLLYLTIVAMELFAPIFILLLLGTWRDFTFLFHLNTSKVMWHTSAIGQWCGVEVTCITSEHLIASAGCVAPAVPCHRGPRSTCGNEASASLVSEWWQAAEPPPAHTGCVTQGRNKLVLLSHWNLRGCLLPWRNLSYPGWFSDSSSFLLEGLIYSVGMPASSSVGGKNVPAFMCPS